MPDDDTALLAVILFAFVSLLPVSVVVIPAAASSWSRVAAADDLCFFELAEGESAERG